MNIKRIVFTYIRKVVLLFIDPVIKVKVSKKHIYMRLSHMLPSYRERFVLYDTSIARIVKYISDIKLDIVNVVDVGANVGDTAAIILSEVEGMHIVCIEGNDEYLPLLHKNFDSLESVIIEDVFCGDYTNNEETGIGVVTKNGTASLVKNSDSSRRIKFKTVDKIVDEHFEGKSVDLLKVDTDGFDYKVIRGAIETIKKDKPYVLFELDKHFLMMNNDEPMSIFELFESCSYSSFIAYDNFGYIIGQFEIGDKDCVEKLIDYFFSKRLYMDILMIADRSMVDTIYYNEEKAIHSLVGVR